MAFNRKARYEIRVRAGNRSDVSGREDHLNCAHFDHTKDTAWYNRASNGCLLTIDEHLVDHLARVGTNGLSISANMMAVSALSRKVEEAYGKELLDAILYLGKQYEFCSEWQKRLYDMRMSWLTGKDYGWGLFSIQDYVQIA